MSLSQDSKKIVVDVNIFLSYIVFGSSFLQKIFDAYKHSRLQLFFNQDFIDELKTKLSHFCNEQTIIDYWEDELNLFGYKINKTVIVEASRDPKDNYLLELAQTIKADFIITRDKDLLDMNTFGSWDSTQIVTPETFVKNYL